MTDLLKYIVYGGTAAVLFLPLLVSDSMFFPYITGKNFWFRIIVELVFASWILLALYEPKYRPRFSWISVGIGSFLVVMFFANLLGEFPLKSFWSNFERMDGYVTLVHFTLYFLVLGSVYSTKVEDILGWKTSSWQIFMVVAMGAALMVSFTAFQQLSGQGNTNGWRIDGSLGNAAYMAVYMLFNTFIAVWLALHTKVIEWRSFWLVLAALFVFLLVQTATRGTILGLAGGTVVGALYIALFNTEYPRVRKVASWTLLVVLGVVGSLFFFRDTAFVQNSPVLERATAVSVSDLGIRLRIWDLAIDGALERPVLGWGQENFNYIFNEHYDPWLGGRAEEWYDRAHNVFLDWFTTGGVLGLVSYLSLFVAAGYYLLWQPFRQTSPFTVLERGLLLGIGSAYFVHNLVVFDNLVSYIFFAILLALIHSQISTPIKSLVSWRVSVATVNNLVTPAVALVAVLVVYFVNVPAMNAASDIIDAFTAETLVARLAAFEQAYERDSFAHQEITEQLVNMAVDVVKNPNVSSADQTAFVEAAKLHLTELLGSKPNDVRLYVFSSTFYRSIGDLEQSRAHALKAHELSPQKPSLLIELGIIEYQADDFDLMLNYFKEAYDLNPDNRQAQIMYATGLLMTGHEASEAEAVITERTFAEFAASDFAVQAANQAEAKDLLQRMFASRIKTDPVDQQNWLNYAILQFEGGDTEGAAETLTEAMKVHPQLEAVAKCALKNLEAGVDINTAC